MAIQLGDAVLRFLADKGQLDKAFKEIPQQADAAATEGARRFDKFARAMVDVEKRTSQIRNSLARLKAEYQAGNITQEQYSRSTAVLSRAQTLLNGGLNTYSSSLQRASLGTRRFTQDQRQAKDAAQLVAQQLGIQLPEAVQKFLAQSPRVSRVLSGMFNVAIVAAFAAAIIELGTTIGNLIVEARGFTAELDRQLQLALRIQDINLDANVEEMSKSVAGLTRRVNDLAAGLGLTREQAEAIKPPEGLKQQTILLAKIDQAAKRTGRSVFQVRDEFLELAAVNASLEKVVVKQAEAEKRRRDEVEKSAEAERKRAEEEAKRLAKEQEREALRKRLELQRETASVLRTLQDENLKLVLGTLEGEQLIQAELEVKLATLALVKSRYQEFPDIVAAATGQEVLLHQQATKKITEARQQMIQELDKLVIGEGIPGAPSPEAIQRLGEALGVKLPEEIEKLILTQEKLRVLGVKSVADLEAELRKAEEAYAALALGGEASLGEILLAQEKLLEKEIEVNLARGESVEELNKKLERQKQLYQEITGQLEENATVGQIWGELWEEISDRVGQSISVNLSNIGANAIRDLTGAFQQGIQAWILGGESLGVAMRRAAASVLAGIAAQSAVLAIFELAAAFAALARLDFRGAALHFKAAAIYGVVAAAAGASAKLIAPPGQAATITGPTGAPGGVVTGPPQPNNPLTVVRRFGEGGLVTRPTLALLGEKGEDEIVLPIPKPRAGSQEFEGQGATQPVTIIIEGLISPDNLLTVMEQMSRLVEGNDAQLSASQARSIVRRS